MVKELNSITVDVNEEGYMTDLSQWNKEVAMAIAAEEGIELTPRHFEVLAYLQDQFKQDIPLSIRKIKTSGVVDIKEFYALFPGGPLKKASKIAGIPKPASCV
jgi:tRNA 2-thiouridine synthesizing protein E